MGKNFYPDLITRKETFPKEITEQNYGIMTKLLEENTGEHICDTGLCKDFITGHKNQEPLKKKNPNKMDLIKIKSNYLILKMGQRFQKTHHKRRYISST